MELSGMSSSTFWPLFLLILQLFFSFSSGQGNETYRLSLLAFKDQIANDPLGILGSWNKSTLLRICGKQRQRVVELDLKSCKLA
jgi:interleukin-1 receptor-associated kinase 1